MPARNTKIGRTKVRDPAREKEHRICVCEIGRIQALLDVAMNKVARMVEQHDDHHNPAQKIDGVDSRREQVLRSLDRWKLADCLKSSRPGGKQLP